MSAIEHYRLFIAIHVPDEIKDAMAVAQSELQRALPEQSVTWTKREQLHLTLKFLGSVKTQSVDALCAQLRATCQGFAPLRLRAQHVGAFPDSSFPRVIWVGLTDADGQLLRMQSAVETASRDFTTQEREQKFTGHVTLGRTRRMNRRNSQILSGLLGGMAGSVFGEWEAKEIELMRSELGSDGARHTSIGIVHLSGVRQAPPI